MVVVGAYCLSRPFTSCLSRHSKQRHGMAGAYCLSRSFTSCLSRHSKQRHGMAGAYCLSRHFTSCISRHSKHGMAGVYCRFRPFTSCLSRHSNYGMAGVLLSVTALHIVPVTSLQARNGGSPIVGHGSSHRACHVTPNTEWRGPTIGHGPSHRACHATPSTKWRESYCRSRSFTSCLSRHSKHGMAGVLLSVTVLHIVPVTSLQTRNGGGLLSVTALHIVPVTSLQTRNGGGLLSVTAVHIVPVTPLQAASRNGGSPTVGHGPSHRACHVTPSYVEGYYPSGGGLAVEWVAWCRLVLVADAERNLLLAVRAILNFFLFLRLDQLLSFLVTEGPHHASAFPQGGPADVRHVVHLSIAQLARDCPCSPRLLSRL